MRLERNRFVCPTKETGLSPGGVYCSQNRLESSKLSCLNDLRTGYLCELYECCHFLYAAFFFISLNINIINFIDIRNARDHVNHEILTWGLG